MIRLLDGTRVGNLDFFLWLPRIRPITFNLLHNLNPLGNLSKNSMLPIQPRCLRGTNEELTSIGIGSSIRHAHRSNSTVSNIKVLIIESSPIDTFPPRSIEIRHVTPLAHESWNDPMENTSLVTKASLAGAELLEIFSGFGYDGSVETHFDSTGWGSTDGYVEEYRVGDFSVGFAKEAGEEVSDPQLCGSAGSGDRSSEHGML